MVRKIVGFIVVLLLASGTVLAAEVPEAIKGTWKLNHDESMALMKTHPRYKESQKDMGSRSIKKREHLMTLTVTSSTVTVAVGKREQVIQFTVVSSSKTEVSTKAKAGENEFDLNLKLIKGKYLQMISSASDDMNFFAWEKKEKGKE